MIDYILFDFDGTVMDTGKGIIHCVQYALEKHGIIENDTSKLRRFVGPPLVESFQEYYGMSHEEAIQAVYDYRELYTPVGVYESELYPGMDKLLADLKSAGKKLAIATSKPLFLCTELLQKEDILQFFDVRFGTSGDERQQLTKAQIIQLALTDLGADLDHSIMVGDTRFDIQGAHTNHLKAVGVRYGYCSEGELEAAGADVIVDDLEQLRSYLFER